MAARIERGRPDDEHLVAVSPAGLDEAHERCEVTRSLSRGEEDAHRA
jgi:hypothetical protein